jgi:RHS repeat-associated protein
VTSTNGITYAYDDNGNLLFDGTTTYEYDAANRLVTATSGSTVSTYNYDGIGNRVAQTANSTTTRYTLDVGSGLYEVIDATTGSDTTRYVQVSGQILARYGEAWGYVLPDHLGTVRQISDVTGDVDFLQHYEPFGAVKAQYGVASSEFGFTGEQEDETGLLFLRARYYDAQTGRFLSQDPWNGNFYRPTTLQGYNYTGNSPINYVDPLGLDREPKVPDLATWTMAGGLDTEYSQKALERLISLRHHIIAAAQRHGFAPQTLCGIRPEQLQLIYTIAAVVYRESLGADQDGFLEVFVTNTNLPPSIISEIREQQLGREMTSEELRVIEERDYSIGIGQLRPSTARELERENLIYDVGTFSEPNRQAIQYNIPPNTRHYRGEVIRLYIGVTQMSTLLLIWIMLDYNLVSMSLQCIPFNHAP